MMTPRTRALHALARTAPYWDDPKHCDLVVDIKEDLAYRVAGRVYVVILPTRDGTSYEVTARDLISGTQIKQVRDLDAAAALAEANRLLRPL